MAYKIFQIQPFFDDSEIKNLEKAGFITLVDGPKKAKIPVLTYQKIEIEV